MPLVDREIGLPIRRPRVNIFSPRLRLGGGKTTLARQTSSEKVQEIALPKLVLLPRLLLFLLAYDRGLRLRPGIRYPHTKRFVYRNYTENMPRH